MKTEEPKVINTITVATLKPGDTVKMRRDVRKDKYVITTVAPLDSKGIKGNEPINIEDELKIPILEA